MSWGDKGEEYRPDRCKHPAGDGCEWCCSTCNYEQHFCPGCGTVTDHKETTCPECKERLRMDERDQAYQSAINFLKANDLEPTQDAAEQLAYAFLPALRIMIERGYDPTGATWKAGGWRGLVYELRKKTNRMWHRSWLHANYDRDSSLDGMNYNGFYYRMECQGPPWGTQGEPSDERVGAVSMGNYSQLAENGGQVGSGQTLVAPIPTAPEGTGRYFEVEVEGHAVQEFHNHTDVHCYNDCPAWDNSRGQIISPFVVRHDHSVQKECHKNCPGWPKKATNS